MFPERFWGKNRLVLASILYWFLVLYISTALVWWFIALQQQNRQMTKYKIEELHHDDPYYPAKLDHIRNDQERKTTQYTGEGISFLVLFLLGAIIVYLPVRKQIKLQQQQQNFMMAVTHELKTPIAVTKLNLETLQKHKLDEQRQQKIILSALQETNRLDFLANNILVAAQLDGGGYRLSKNELDLSSLVVRAATDFKNRFPERRWQINIAPGIFVDADSLLLQILINNLLENAVKYSHKEGLISVELATESQRPVLRVKDEGPGIADTEKKKIFGKFYRIGSEGTRTSPGTGLGLYLCKKIASDHQAMISVSDHVPAGSIFTVKF